MVIDEIKKEGLTPAQLEAVGIIDENLEMIACAGAGKTKTITLRIINLIANGADPGSIVAITFTRKAAAEMRTRIYDAAKKYLKSTEGLASMYIGTIDAFCLRMLQDYEPEFARFSVLDEVQTKVFLERYALRSDDQTGLYGSVIDNAPNLYKNENYGKKLSHYSGLMSILNSCWYDRKYRNRWSEDTKERLAKFNACLYKNRLFDFSSIIREMIERLDPDSDRNKGSMSAFGEKVFSSVKYLIIDEYQDTNPPQEYLAGLFYKYGKTNICVVGDPDQTIYQFRGSCERNILEFPQKFKAKTIRLDQNFRSTEAVIDIARNSIEKNHENDPDPMKMVQGKRADGSPEKEDADTVWKEFPSFSEEASFIADRVGKLHETGIPYTEIAVLFRRRREFTYGVIEVDFQEVLVEKLKEKGIRYVVEGLNNLHNTAEYKAAREIFRFLWFGYFKKAEGSGGDVDRKEILKQAWINLGQEYGSPELIEGIDRAIDVLSSVSWSSLKFGHEFNMQQIFQDFIGNLALIDSESEEAEEILYNLGKFSRIIGDYELMFFKESPSYKAEKFQRHIDIVAKDLYPEGKEDNAYIQTDAVHLMTVHQAKGLEFAAVFVPALCKDIFPGEGFEAKGTSVYSPLDAIDLMSKGQSESWIPNYREYKGSKAAERKLFYVAVTRAKKYLFLTYGTTYGNKSETESPFLKEVKASKCLKEYSDSDVYTADHLPDMRQDPIPVVLNFSLLSNYYDCPYRFKLSNFYGFVQPYSSSQGYGRMLHEIMMHIHRSWIDGRQLTHDEVDKIAENALYLPFANKVQLDNSLKGAKDCAHAYVKQNESDADKMIASEMDINLELGEGVSVNGRIDLVKKIEEDGKEKVAIIDLKSAGKDAEQCLNAEQLKIYALGYQDVTGTNPDYLMIYNLDHPDGSRNAQEKVQEKVLVEVQKGILRAAKCIRESELPRQKGEKCTGCYVKHLCEKKK